MKQTDSKIIAAVNKNNVIGKNGDIPWHYPEDLRHYRNTVHGNIVLMGRKTFESAPTLDDTEHIVMSRRDEIDTASENVHLANSKSEAVSLYDTLRDNNKELYVCGGEEIYREFLDDVNTMVISHIPDDSEGDAHFPEIDDSEWEIENIKFINEFRVCYYKRIE